MERNSESYRVDGKVVIVKLRATLRAVARVYMIGTEKEEGESEEK